MKKLLLSFFGVLIAFAVNAQFKFKNIDNNNGKTTIVVINDSLKWEPNISNVKFNNKGKIYNATSISSAQNGNRFSVILTFKHMTVFNNSEVSFMVNNNQEVTIPIYETMSKMDIR